MTLKDEIECHILALLNADGFGPFNPGVMGDTLLSELEDSWHVMPDTTKAIMLGVAAELKRNFADDVMAGIKATQVVNRLRGQS